MFSHPCTHTCLCPVWQMAYTLTFTVHRAKWARGCVLIVLHTPRYTRVTWHTCANTHGCPHVCLLYNVMQVHNLTHTHTPATAHSGLLPAHAFERKIFMFSCTLGAPEHRNPNPFLPWGQRGQVSPIKAGEAAGGAQGDLGAQGGTLRVSQGQSSVQSFQHGQLAPLFGPYQPGRKKERRERKKERKQASKQA